MQVLPLTTTNLFEPDARYSGVGSARRHLISDSTFSLRRLKAQVSAGTDPSARRRSIFKSSSRTKETFREDCGDSDSDTGTRSGSSTGTTSPAQAQIPEQGLSAQAQAQVTGLTRQRPAESDRNVDHHLITIPSRPPLPRFHSRQHVPYNDEYFIPHHQLKRKRSSTPLPANRHLPCCPTPRSTASIMALKFLSGHGHGHGHSPPSGSSSSVKFFDIRLDNDYIVFRGNEDEAASAQLAGSLVLCLTEPMQISHINLTLSGIIHMSYQVTSTSAMSGRRIAYKEKTFFEKSWPFRVPGKNKSEVLQPDNYEWPFDCILEGGLPESVEGLKDAWIIYRLKAEIGRKRGKDIVVRKPLRIVRTLDPSALELAHAMSVENIWPNKVEYSISIPSKAIIFGSFLQVDFKLIPLLKGLHIGGVVIQLKEEQEFVVDPEWNVSALSGGQTKVERLIASDSYVLDPEKDEQIIDEAAEGFQFTRYLELPKTLNKCLQDCNVKGIKIRHKAKFNIQLHNPDGHISELRANLPVSLYISPSLPLNENNDLVDQSPQAARAAADNEVANSAPPTYGEHNLDKLYSEMDPSGYLTPGNVLSTPGTPYVRSRTASMENIRNFEGPTSSNLATSLPTGTFVSPAALQHRLQNLHIGGPSGLIQEDVDIHVHPASNAGSRRASDHNHNGDYFSPHDDSGSQSHQHRSPGEHGYLPQSGSNPLSRRGSEVDVHHSGNLTPYGQYDHMEDLAKLPSYTTAVKTPVSRQTPYSSSTDLPSYGAVITSSTSSPLTEPASAHIRQHVRHTSPGYSPSETPFNGGRTPPMNRNLSSLQDEERRLRVLQARGR